MQLYIIEKVIGRVIYSQLRANSFHPCHNIHIELFPLRR